MLLALAAALFALDYRHRGLVRELHREHAAERARWQEERLQLLDRLHARNLTEYKHITGERTKPPRVAKPMRHVWQEEDAVPEEAEGG